MTTRRELLKLGTMAGVAALVPGVAGAGRSRLSSPSATDSPIPTRDQLLAQLNTRFFVQPDDRPAVALVLVEVADPAHCTARSQPERFRAVFRGPRSLPLRQDTYVVANGALGEFPLFLVPVGRPTARACYYEAAFNRTGTV
jgi:hypothetical protein